MFACICFLKFSSASHDVYYLYSGVVVLEAGVEEKNP